MRRRVYAYTHKSTHTNARTHTHTRQAIAWLRIVRPGSVLGLQQQFLEMVEDPRRQGRLNLDITPSMLEEMLDVYDAGRCGHDTSVAVSVRLVCA